MVLTFQKALVRALKKLDDSSFQRFIEKLSVWEVKEEYSNIPRDKLTGKDPKHIAGLIKEYYNYSYGAELILAVLEDINEKKVREELQHDLRKVGISGKGLTAGMVAETELMTGDEYLFYDNTYEAVMINDLFYDNTYVESAFMTDDKYLFYDKEIEYETGFMRNLQMEEQMENYKYSKARQGKDLAILKSKKTPSLSTKFKTFWNKLRRKDKSASAMNVEPGDLFTDRSEDPEISYNQSYRLRKPTMFTETSQDTAEPRRSRVKRTLDDVSCKLCGEQAPDSADLVHPYVFDSVYGLELNSPGLYRCQKTGIKFLVKGPVTIEYKLDSWSDHLKLIPDNPYEILGPLFNIQTRGEPDAVSAVYLPHYLCLKAFTDGTELIKCAHFRDGNMTLESPAQIEPYYITLENPTFSCLGPLLSLRKKVPIHGSVFIYFRIICKGDPHEEYKIHLYVLPYYRNAEQILDKENKTFGFQRIKKPAQTTETVYTKVKYLVTGHPDVSARPKTLKFDSEQNQFTEIRFREKVIDMFLYVSEEKIEDTVWDTHLTQNDLTDVTQLLSQLTIQEAPDGAFRESAVYVQKQQPLSEALSPGACPLPDHFVDRHREALIQRTSHISPVLDNLLGQRLLTLEQYDTLRSIRPHQEAMRQLYKYGEIWGHSDKEKFYQALKTYNEPLIRDLENILTVQL